MKKLSLICAAFIAQPALAVVVQSSHPIYFISGDVKPHQSVYFELPSQKMQHGALYDMSCQITGIDIFSFKPVIYAKILGNVPGAYPSETNSVLNGMSMKYPFQDKLISKSNDFIIRNVIYNDKNAPLKLQIYNFDDKATLTFSNCYVIVSKQNA